MADDIAIRVRGLGKKYTLGGSLEKNQGDKLGNYKLI
jgi:hypothetical protein